MDAMNYTLRDLVLGFTADRAITAQEFADGMNRLTDRIPQPARAAMLNLLGSHDTDRVLTRHGGDEARALLAYTLLFAAEGAPMLYTATRSACKGTPTQDAGPRWSGTSRAGPGGCWTGSASCYPPCRDRRAAPRDATGQC